VDGTADGGLAGSVPGDVAIFLPFGGWGVFFWLN
jgi:hypothetical protein